MDEKTVGAVPDRTVSTLELPAEGRVMAWEERTVAEGTILACEMSRVVRTRMIRPYPSSLNLVVDLLRNLLHGDRWMYRLIQLLRIRSPKVDDL